MSDGLLESLWTNETVCNSNLFEGKVALVAGGGSGIGRATAVLFARLGAKVFITGRKQEKLDAVIAFATQQGAQMQGIAANLREHEQVLNVFSSVEAAYGEIDHVINSAGGHFPQDAIDFSPKGWNTVITTISTAPVHPAARGAALARSGPRRLGGQYHCGHRSRHARKKPLGSFAGPTLSSVPEPRWRSPNPASI